MANTTLAFPQEPYAYSVANAFPGMNFDSVVAFATPPGETNRLFIVEKGGRIQVITNLANPNARLFLNLSAKVDSGEEGGLLGLAFHPGYASNRLFFVYYTLQTSTALGSGLHDRLSRFEASVTNLNQADAASETVLISQYDRAGNHNGGDLHFGPDGYLYVSLGDEGGGGYDQYLNSRTITRNFFAGMLRLDVDKRPGSLTPNAHPAGSTNYAVPSDNPFVGATNFNGVAIDPAAVRTEFWAVGLRNPWRFSFDADTGRLFCGDVGEGSREEVNIIVKGGHYGWNYREGNIAAQGTPPPGSVFLAPILEYPHGSGTFQGSSVTGGRVYRGAKMPGLYGDYIFADHVSGNIWAVDYDGTTASNWRKLTSDVGVACFGVDPSNGDLLYSFPWSFAAVMRLVATPGASLPARLSDTGAFQNLATLTPSPGVVDYDLNAPFWSDHAKKQRWFAVPRLNQFVSFSSNGNWSFPTGTVWVKHFEMELTNGVATSARRLETRFMVKNNSGAYGLTYKWNAAQTDATLVGENGLDETLVVRDGGTVRTQVWHYPARSECATCHTPAGGYALGFNTPQVNRARDDGGTPVNQILWLNQMGYFNAPVTSTNGLLAYSHPYNSAATLDLRVRSYLGANCVQCHQPGGTGRGLWDARLHTPWTQAGLINGPLISDFGNGNARVIRPGNPDDSMLHARVSQLGALHMPPLATTQLDPQAIALLSEWINDGLAGARIVSVELGADSRMRFSFAGEPGRSYRVEASGNFGAWTAVGTTVSGPDGAGQFIDSTVVVPASQFRAYRLAWP